MKPRKIPTSSIPFKPGKQMELQRKESPINMASKLLLIKKTTVLQMIIKPIIVIVNKDVDTKRLKRRLNAALGKDVDQGILVNHLKTASTEGAIGHFMLPKNPKMFVKKPTMSFKKTRISLKTNKASPKIKTGKKTTKKLTGQTDQKNIVSNPPKSSKIPVKKKTATTTQQKAKVEKKIETKGNSNEKIGKKNVAKVPLNSEAEKSPAAKVSLKGRAGKKLATKIPLKAKAEEKTKEKMPSNDENTEFDGNIHSEDKIAFSDSDENVLNEDVISEASEEENFEDQAKNNSVSEKKFKEQPAIKDKKRVGSNPPKTSKIPVKKKTTTTTQQKAKRDP